MSVCSQINALCLLGSAALQLELLVSTSEDPYCPKWLYTKKAVTRDWVPKFLHHTKRHKRVSGGLQVWPETGS